MRPTWPSMAYGTTVRITSGFSNACELHVLAADTDISGIAVPAIPSSRLKICAYVRDAGRGTTMEARR